MACSDNLSAVESKCSKLLPLHMVLHIYMFLVFQHFFFPSKRVLTIQLRKNQLRQIKVRWLFQWIFKSSKYLYLFSLSFSFFLRYLPSPIKDLQPLGLTTQMPMDQMHVRGATAYGPEHQTNAQRKASLNLLSAQCQGHRPRQQRTGLEGRYSTDYAMSTDRYLYLQHKIHIFSSLKNVQIPLNLA